MRGFPPIAPRDTARVRRWDAIVLGGALPGLVAAVRLGMRGARVLVVEEEAAARAFEGLREPFVMAGPASDGVLGSCLQALGIPLIERHRIETRPVAYQLVLPNARIDVGVPDDTARELAAWGVSSFEAASAATASLAEDAAEMTASLLSARIVRPGGLRVRTRRSAARVPAAVSPAARPAPTFAWASCGALEPLFAAQLRVLSNFGGAPPTREVRARLLGSVLGGAACLAGATRSLRRLLRTRIESLHGEFRRIAGAFQMVSASNLPAIAAERMSDVLACRALLINAPPSALRAALAQDSPPALLSGPEASHVRVALHLRGARRLLPEGMADRVICVRDPAGPPGDANVVGLRSHRSDGDALDLVATAVMAVSEASTARLEAAVKPLLVELMPFSEGGFEVVDDPRPRWDRDDPLGDHEASQRWPSELPLRPVARVPAYVLDRWQTGALGFEGDLLLGWRAGDAIAADLG